MRLALAGVSAKAALIRSISAEWSFSGGRGVNDNDKTSEILQDEKSFVKSNSFVRNSLGKVTHSMKDHFLNQCLSQVLAFLSSTF